MKTANKTQVQDCMTHNVITVTRDASLIKAIQLMDLNGLSALPVVDQDSCVCGILSTSDLISMMYELQSDISVLPHVSNLVRQTLIDALAEDNESVNVTGAMTCDVETIDGHANLAEAARLLVKNQCHHLPVVDPDGKPIGIISTTDIVRTIASQFVGCS